MKLIVTLLFFLQISNCVAQLKLPDPQIIWNYTSTLSPSSGYLPEKTCPAELKISIIITVDQNEKVAVPLRGYHFVDGILRDSLELVEHAEVFKRGDSFKGSPFYYILAVEQDKNLYSKSLHRVLTKPEAIQAVQNNTLINHRSIIITVPFEHSPATGPIKVNSYEFLIGNQMYSLDKKKFLPDPNLANNKIHIDHYKRCNTTNRELIPQIGSNEKTDETETGKLIQKMYPTDKSLKTGSKLSVVLAKELNGKPIDINKVQAQLVNVYFNKVLKPTDIDFNSNTLLFSIPESFVGLSVCQVFYEGEIDTRKAYIN